MTLESIEKVGDIYRAQVTLETSQQNNAAVGGFNIQVVQIQGGFTGPMANPQGMPNLVDAQGKNYQIMQVQNNMTRINNGVARRTYMIQYRAGAGQGDPSRLVLSEPRLTNIAVPFEFKNVQLP